MHDSLGDRIKRNYENRHRHYLTRRTPVIVRLDGKAFHSFTSSMERPFSKILMSSMVSAALEVFRKTQGAQLAYIQSDEVSILITDYDTLETQAYFDYCQNKIESVSASLMTAHFNYIFKHLSDPSMNVYLNLAAFDARAFNIPEHEVPNYFIWRQNDWERNSLGMYCSSFFSHAELDGKSTPERHEMLHSIGKNWAKDLTDQQKNGTWWFKGAQKLNHSRYNYEDIVGILEMKNGQNQ